MASTQPKPVAMSVAGLDPAASAGVLADLKTFVAHDCYGVAAVAAIVIQAPGESGHVERIEPVQSAFLKAQIQMLLDEVAVAGIKIGLSGTRGNLHTIAEALASRSHLPIVADPVLQSASGEGVFQERDLASLRKALFPLVRVLTPNAEEAGRLLGIRVSTLEEMKGAAKLLHEQGVRHVVVTGGHLEKPSDVYFEGQEIEVFTGQRSEAGVRGTGCAFSSAILANLITGKPVRESVVLAKAYVAQAVARSYPIGSIRNPLNHLFRYGEAPVRAGGPELLHSELH